MATAAHPGSRARLLLEANHDNFVVGLGKRDETRRLTVSFFSPAALAFSLAARINAVCSAFDIVFLAMFHNTLTVHAAPTREKAVPRRRRGAALSPEIMAYRARFATQALG
jgi:hypothetical protein